MTVIVCGVDPGAKGAVAWMTGEGVLIDVLDLPVAEVKVGKTNRKQLLPAVLAALLEANRPVHLILEHVGAQPGDGAVGAFSFGRGFGQIEGVVAGIHIPYTLVRPQVWKRAMGVPADKNQSRARACQLFPSHAAKFSRVEDDGRAEAALIALYGVRNGFVGRQLEDMLS